MKENKINIGNSQKEKILTNELKINRNVFIYNNSFIPLSNISRVGIVNAKKQEYSVACIIMIVIGLFMLFAGEIMILIGLVFIAAGAYSIYKTYKNNQELGEFLVLSLNSGRDIYLYSTNHAFSVEIMDVMINCINSGSEYKINMSNCQIEACQFGDGNNMISEGK